MALVDIQVPDIGDFDEVGVIEVLVKPGDTVKAEQSLITVESDKASMEIPSSHAGVVKELKVKLGDQVKQVAELLPIIRPGRDHTPRAIRKRYRNYFQPLPAYHAEDAHVVEALRCEQPQVPVQAVAVIFGVAQGLKVRDPQPEERAGVVAERFPV